MSRNRSFFIKAEQDKIEVRDIFSDLFRHHTKEESSGLFLAGTPMTTPDERSMLSSWVKPYIFFRVFVIGIVLIQVCIFMDNRLLLPFIFMVGSFVVPIAEMFFFWEMNIPRNISFTDVLMIFFVGGVVSLLFTTYLSEFNVFDGQYMYWIGVGLVEELAKLLAAMIWIYKRDTKYILTGMLIGAAIGAGFAAVESAGYAVIRAKWSYDTMTLRALLAVGGHTTWAAISCGALVWAKGKEKLSTEHVKSPIFLKYFISVVIMHGIWDIFAGEGSLPKLYLMCAVALYAAYRVLKCGLKQAVEAAAGGQPAMSCRYFIYGTKGYLKGQYIPIHDTLYMGRNPGKDHLVFPANTAGVSGEHLILGENDGKIFVKDRNSRFGIFINGTRIRPDQVYELRVGDYVSIGSAQQEFCIVRKE